MNEHKAEPNFPLNNKESSQKVPDLALASMHPENIITQEDIEKWLLDLEKFVKNVPAGRYGIQEVITDDKLDKDNALKRYHEGLRFLSRTDTIAGLRQFASEIVNTFDPQTSLFYFPPESVSANLFYNNLVAIDPNISTYGIAKDTRRS